MPQQENTMNDLLNWTGLIIGSATFFLIGIFHVVVIKAEYYFGKNIWPAFAFVGTAALTPQTQETLELAAVVHDIACPLCREKYGNTTCVLLYRT